MTTSTPDRTEPELADVGYCEAHYHKRSNVESTFSMIRRKFGEHVRSKTDTAMVNEALAKVLCHNLVVLIHEIYELGIAPVFWADSSPAQEIAG